MKNYTITVNGVAYDVTVEEGGPGPGSRRPRRRLRTGYGSHAGQDSGR